MNWREQSREILLSLVSQTPQVEGESLKDWGKRLKAVIAERYPYARRHGFAYQAWLYERKFLLYQLGIEGKPPKKAKSKSKKVAIQKASVEGQLDLLDWFSKEQALQQGGARNDPA